MFFLMMRGAINIPLLRSEDANPLSPVVLHRSTKRLETCTKFGNKDLRLFPGREVPALLDLVVMDEFRIRPLRPTPRGRIELVRKDAHGNRDGGGDAFDSEERRPLVLPIETGRQKAPCSSTR